MATPIQLNPGWLSYDGTVQHGILCCFDVIVGFVLASWWQYYYDPIKIRARIACSRVWQVKY